MYSRLLDPTGALIPVDSEKYKHLPQQIDMGKIAIIGQSLLHHPNVRQQELGQVGFTTRDVNGIQTLSTPIIGEETQIRLTPPMEATPCVNIHTHPPLPYCPNPNASYVSPFPSIADVLTMTSRRHPAVSLIFRFTTESEMDKMDHFMLVRTADTPLYSNNELNRWLYDIRAGLSYSTNQIMSLAKREEYIMQRWYIPMAERLKIGVYVATGMNTCFRREPWFCRKLKSPKRQLVEANLPTELRDGLFP